MSGWRAGVGFADSPDSFAAGERAAARCLEKMDGDRSSLLLAFCAGRHDHRACFAGIRSVSGQVPVIGGSAIGVITADDLGYGGYQVGVAALPDDLIFDIAAVGGLDRGEREAGLQLGRQLSERRSPAERLNLLFYDSVQSPPPPSPVLNVSSYLLDGFEQGLGPSPPPIVGAGLIGGFSFERGEQFCGAYVDHQQAVAALLSGDCAAHVSIMHGCKPMSDYHTITRIEGPVVYEIDGRPALDVIDDLLGGQDWQSRLPLLLVTLGVNHGEKFAPYDEKSYVSRLIIGIVPEERAIVLFEADFADGTQFQFMRRNAQLMAESAEKGCREAVADLRQSDQDPCFALYIDCAGRTASFSGAEREEASIVQQIVGCDIPLLGFYSGVEIAPLMGRSRGLDWTGVLLILSRSRRR